METDKLPLLDDFRLEVMMNLGLSDIALDVVDEDGNRPVVVALDDESLATLMRRVATVGGYANVFSRGVGIVRRVAIMRTESAIFADDAEDMTVDAPSGLSTVGAFLDYVASQRHGVKIPAILPRVQQPATARHASEVQFQTA